MTRTQRKAFTLIELLVVIAIIAILASILFPVFARARENARRSSCMSNLKQIGLAIEQYKQDYDGFYPFARLQGLDKKADSWYGNFLEPYIKSRQIVFCPSAPEDWPIHYSYNIAFGYELNPPGSPWDLTICGVDHPIFTGINDAFVTSPSTSIVAVDAALVVWHWRSVGDNSMNPDYFNAMWPTSLGTPMVKGHEKGLHFDGVNSMYADGHVKWNRVESLWGNSNLPKWCAAQS